MRISKYHLHLKYHLDQMSRYLNLMESSFGQRLDDLDGEYEDALATVESENESDWVHDHYTDLYIEVGNDFPRHLRSSFVVAWYSFMEQTLLNLCSDLGIMDVTTDGKKKYPKASGVYLAELLLKERNYVIDSSHGDQLHNIRKLRNIIVHEGTRLKGDHTRPNDPRKKVTEIRMALGISYFQFEEPLWEYMKNNGIVDADTSSAIWLEIIPTYEYCRSLIPLSEVILSKLYNHFQPTLASKNRK